ncbi:MULTISPECIES: hypothetical protein [Emticicia]|uniref:hypothetical protein n=1 Tax=Emticicia TaxID=312278 RepID=UPI0007D8BEFF|nr:MULTISPECIES: hypothetical protein [Emticicia]
MSKFQKQILFVYLLLFIYDLYDCTKTGFEVSLWFRPVQMLVLFIFVYHPKLSFLESSLIFGSLLLTSITEYIFYSTGLVHANTLIVLLLLKNLCFIIILQNPKNKLRFSLKLFRWIFTYLIISITICLLVVGNENLYFYLLAIQSGMILFLISLQVRDLSLFRQMYLGYALVILAMIFGKILISDSRWFIEILTRLALLLGHLFFISSLTDLKLFPTKSNTLDNQTVN